LKRIDGRYILQEIGDFFLANKGMVYTIKNVLIKPGESVRQFISEDRYRFVKPITFLFITSVLYALVSNQFDTDKYFQISVEDSKVSLFLNRIFENFGYLNLLIGIFVALWAKILFKKADYNLYEIYILFCFVFGIVMLFHSVTAIIQEVTHLKFYAIGTLYITWAIGQFFDKKKVVSYIKALFSFLLGGATLGILAGVAIFIEFVIK